MRAFTSNTVSASPSLEYADNRSSIRNGDVLMYRGRTMESRIIQWATHSRYSHAGLAVWWNNRLMVMEAVGKGVIVTPLSNNVSSYRGDVEWFTSVEEIPEDQRMVMVDFAQQELGKEYALWRAVLLGVRLLFKHDLRTRDHLRREGRLFCSHYVAETYNALGRDLKRGVSDRFMSPGDIASSPLLKRIGTLRKRRASKKLWSK
jgi:hypothetical protein